ncbi:MAG: glutamine-fructose-6-phosphate transaminase (isomerizing) GlmS [Oceanicaulis sp. HLUCCA04]|nr:MAG: glutamine-fructose-6-phosphate transaminase (isomerizing) GlmS [Oceanicaulis sp. HLUCCA04]
MCGIVGAVGHGEAESFILEGLRRLEYRGYDSAGIGVIDSHGSLHRLRAAGKVQALADRVPAGLHGTTAIGHTRWATHGAANDDNAHPHKAGRVLVVHNGIIENFKTLREELAAKGCEFTSQTDTEVVAHLIDQAMQADGDAVAALKSVLRRLDGAFALGVMIEGEEGFIMGARKGAPLIAGLGATEGFLGSDPLALSGHAERIMFLDDGDMAVIRPGSIEVFDLNGEPVERKLVPAETSHVLAEKGNHRHFMEKEIHEQPEVIGRTISHYADAFENGVHEIAGLDFRAASRLIIVGCGTAAYAGEISRYWFGSLARLAVEVDIASEFRYRDPVFLPGDIALFISQSGETADTLEAMRLAAAAGVQTLALVNTPHSTIAREASLVVPTLAGPEIGVASTKAFTSQLSALACLAVLAGRHRGHLDRAQEAGHVAGLLAAPGLMVKALEREGEIEKLAHEIAGHPTVLYLGRNQNFPLALEAALKLKEISYIHAEGYAAGELKHGPIALIEEGLPVIVIAPHDALFDKTRSSIQQVASRGAHVIAITDPEGAKALEGEAAHIINLPKGSQLTNPLLFASAIQLLAYHVAVYKGTDVDQPRNLAKSVTVE